VTRCSNHCLLLHCNFIGAFDVDTSAKVCELQYEIWYNIKC